MSAVVCRHLFRALTSADVSAPFWGWDLYVPARDGGRAGLLQPADDDPHPAQDGRSRCRFHHGRRRAFDTARSDAKRDGLDVTGPEWQWEKNIPPRPEEVRALVPPEIAWARAAEAYEAVYDLSGPLAAHANRGTAPSSKEAQVLSRALAELTFAMEPLLYGPGQAPGGAAGPPSQAPHDLGGLEPHVRHYPDEDPPDLERFRR